MTYEEAKDRLAYFICIKGINELDTKCEKCDKDCEKCCEAQLKIFDFLEKAEKYKWHSLTTQNDLPDVSSSERILTVTDDGIYYDMEAEDFVRLYRNGDMKFNSAWKYIEPFERSD